MFNNRSDQMIFVFQKVYSVEWRLSRRYEFGNMNKGQEVVKLFQGINDSGLGKVILVGVERR